VDDSADATARTVTLSTISQNFATYGQISGLAPANINYGYADTSSVTVNTGTAAGNVVNVLTTDVTTNLVGNAALTVNVGNGSHVNAVFGSAAGIFGDLNIANSPGFNSTAATTNINTITVDDSAYTTPRTAYLETLRCNGCDGWLNPN
jgi:hypothetical protein